jgi:hypothetical protein
MADESYSSKVARVPSPDGTLFVTFIEDKEQRPFRIDINIGKAGNPVAAWASAAALACSKLLQSGHTLSDLIEMYSEITSYRAVTDINTGVTIRSGIEGFVHAMFLYRAGKFEELRTTLGLPSEIDLADSGPKTSQ